MSEHKERKTLEERHQMSDLERLRHSCAHVLATAICRLWPDAQLAGGPAVDNGFYYDVELDHRISTEDFERIEEEMKKVVKEKRMMPTRNSVWLYKNSPISSRIMDRLDPS